MYIFQQTLKIYLKIQFFKISVFFNILALFVRYIGSIDFIEAILKNNII